VIGFLAGAVTVWGHRNTGVARALPPPRWGPYR
jgi:hypothetical protein